MFYSLAAPILPRQNQQMDVQWDPDANFGAYLDPQSERGTSEALEEECIVYTGLEANTSTASKVGSGRRKESANLIDAGPWPATRQTQRRSVRPC